MKVISAATKIQLFKPNLHPFSGRSMAEPLPSKEVVGSVYHGNKKAPFAATSWLNTKPSDGLEPRTPSLPSSGEAGSAGKRGNSRARKPRKKKETAEDE